MVETMKRKQPAIHRSPFFLIVFGTSKAGFVLSPIIFCAADFLPA
jgi:hypothetical protein